MSDHATLQVGDCIEVMATMEPNSVDAIVTDPPYGLEFMGKDFDSLSWKWRDFEALPAEWIAEYRREDNR
jgi:site-specific DNA-methyltransferase (adenine-specific)